MRGSFYVLCTLSVMGGKKSCASPPRALPILEKYHTGKECDHDQYLCQGELEKAIKLCKGETPNLLCIKTP